jgi:hypothetical protein
MNGAWVTKSVSLSLPASCADVRDFRIFE